MAKTSTGKKIGIGAGIAVAFTAAVTGGVLYHNDEVEKQRIADLKADAAAVDTEIASIGDVDLNDGDTIDKAEKDYSSLSDEGKGYVTKEEILKNSRTQYDALKKADQEARASAKDVDTKINAIGTVTLDSGDVIATARSGYNALNDAAKGYVTQYDTLQKAESDYSAALTAKAEADKAAAEKAAQEKAAAEAAKAAESAKAQASAKASTGSSKASSGKTKGKSSSSAKSNTSSGKSSSSSTNSTKSNSSASKTPEEISAEIREKDRRENPEDAALYDELIEKYGNTNEGLGKAFEEFWDIKGGATLGEPEIGD